MRGLRMFAAGYIMAIALYIMPRGRLRETLVDEIDRWQDMMEAEANQEDGMKNNKLGHPIWLGELEDGKFYAISNVTPRFCLQADSIELARQKAITALEQYRKATPSRPHSTRTTT